MSEIEANLARLGIELPPAPSALGNFAPYLLDGAFLYISGQISANLEGSPITGKIGKAYTLEHGYTAARFCAINLLARAKAALGDLDRIEKLIKLGAFVNADPDFDQHPKVVNGASDLMTEVLGREKANHVRFAVGSSSLPSNASVEIEAVFRIAE
ncbi:MAG: RidA family protein [Roseibium sp.]|uniref:RidA family protein n=1 Tax=Roseibium sp. TaxID=1936156 RepID=UPI00261EFCC7|nr:RidA family protein [Roseibium sp.]MCV0424723.1 RidA family protein [Roseibium sp.]